MVPFIMWVNNSSYTMYLFSLIVYLCFNLSMMILLVVDLYFSEWAFFIWCRIVYSLIKVWRFQTCTFLYH